MIYYLITFLVCLAGFSSAAGFSLVGNHLDLLNNFKLFEDTYTPPQCPSPTFYIENDGVAVDFVQVHYISHCYYSYHNII